MRTFAVLALALLVSGCRSTDPYTVPDVPPEASMLVLSDDEMPRTVYASVWGAFAVAGWEVVQSDPDAFRLTVRAPEASAPLDLVVEAEMEYGQAVAAQAVATSTELDVLEAAAAVLATIPGHLAVR